MTENQIIILCFVVFWMLVSMLTYILLLRYTRKEYKKFYPHPIVNIVKEINSDTNFKFWEKLFLFTCLNIVYLPIICEWLIAWCLYKFWKFIYIDATEHWIEEEIKEKSPNSINEETTEQDKASLHAEQMEKDLENPEYISRDFLDEQPKQSQEFFDYLKVQNIQSESPEREDSNLSLDVSEQLDLENKNYKEKLPYSHPMVEIKQDKPKSKYSKKKKDYREDGVIDETKNN